MRSDGHWSSLPLPFIPVSHCSVHVPSCLQVYSNMRRSTRARPLPAWHVTKIALGCAGRPADRRASWAVNSLLLVSDRTTCLLPTDWLTTRQARRQRQRQQQRAEECRAGELTPGRRGERHRCASVDDDGGHQRAPVAPGGGRGVLRA